MNQLNDGVNINQFAFKLINQQYPENLKNILLSPPNIALALILLANGAGKEPYQAILKTLQFPELELDGLNNLFVEIINNWNIQDPAIEITTASSIWIDQGFNLSGQYVKQMQKIFNAHVQSTNLAKAERIINAWISNATHEMLPEIVTADFLQDIDTLLINALYFKGMWKKPFQEVIPWGFKLLDGSSREHQLMLIWGRWNYYEDSEVQVVGLPYGDNEAMSMIVVLPKNPWSSFLTVLDLEHWDRWMAGLNPMGGAVWLPKFKATVQLNLLAPLIDCGLRPAVSDADYRPLGMPRMTISDILHDVCLEVDEKGSRAAAVTRIAAKMTGLANVEKTFTMQVDRPFCCAIRDNRNGMIVFLGLITDPEELE